MQVADASLKLGQGNVALGRQHCEAVFPCGHRGSHDTTAQSRCDVEEVVDPMLYARVVPLNAWEVARRVSIASDPNDPVARQNARLRVDDGVKQLADGGNEGPVSEFRLTSAAMVIVVLPGVAASCNALSFQSDRPGQRFETCGAGTVATSTKLPAMSCRVIGARLRSPAMSSKSWSIRTADASQSAPARSFAWNRLLSRCSWLTDSIHSRSQVSKSFRSAALRSSWRGLYPNCSRLMPVSSH